MSYIKQYLEYAGNDEAPELFHVWAGYMSIAAVLGRRVWLPRAPFVRYGNLYVLYVGDAGCGKSHALYKLKRVLAFCGDVKISSSVETVEGITRYLSGTPDHEGKARPSECLEKLPWPDGTVRDTHNLLILANEFINFIRTGPEAWTGFLNDIYDEDHHTYRTKNKGSDSISGPYICLIGAVPTDVSKKLQQIDIINTGFARRTILQYGRRRFENPRPRPDKTQEESDKEAQELAKRLKAIRKLRGAMTETPEAAKFYDDWYCDHSRGLLKRSTPATQGWLSSKPDQVIKIAILNSIGNRDDLTVQASDYETALFFLGEMEKTMTMVFGGVGRNELAAIAVRLLEFLNNIKEPVTVKYLTMRFYSQFSAGKGKQELDDVLAHLKLSGEIVYETLEFPMKLPDGSTLLNRDEYLSTPAIMSAYKAALAAQQSGAPRVESDWAPAAKSGPSAAPTQFPDDRGSILGQTSVLSEPED